MKTKKLETMVWDSILANENEALQYLEDLVYQDLKDQLTKKQLDKAEGIIKEMVDSLI